MNFFSHFPIILVLILFQTFPYFSGQKMPPKPNVDFPGQNGGVESNEEIGPDEEMPVPVDNEEEIPTAAPPITGFKGIPKTASVFYDNGKCGIWDDAKGEYVLALDHSYGTDGPLEIGCVNDFHEWAERMGKYSKECGDPYYELRKQCILVHAFENGPASESAIVKGDKQDLALVFFDGCTICDFRELFMQKHGLTEFSNDTYYNLPNAEIEIWATYEWKAGSTFTKCYAETKEGQKSTMNSMIEKISEENDVGWIQKGKIWNVASFYQRKCMGMFSADEMADRFDGIKLHIKHNCHINNETVHLEFALPDIIPVDHPNHVAEMRGLNLLLHQNKMSQVHFRPDGGSVQSAGLSWDSLRNKNA